MHFAQPAVTARVVGLRSHEQLGPARRAPDVELEELTFVRIDGFSPVHRTAPEYCAW